MSNIEDKKLRLKKVIIRNRIIGSIAGIVGLFLLFQVDWKVAVGAFLLAYGSNLEFSSGIAKKLSEVIDGIDIFVANQIKK